MTPKPFTVLTIVRADSGSWEYEIRISHKTGITYCTCKGWQFRKTCKHLDAYNADPAFAPGTVPTAPVSDLAGTKIRKPVVPAPTTPAAVLLKALAEWNVTHIPAEAAKRIADRVLETVGAKSGAVAASAMVASGTSLNVGNVRVITLPD